MKIFFAFVTSALLNLTVTAHAHTTITENVESENVLFLVVIIRNLTLITLKIENSDFLIPNSEHIKN